MNAKKAKTLRRALRAAGVDPTSTEYAETRHKTRRGIAWRTALTDQSGRKAYAIAKKMAR